ncbi:MAG: transcriptional regulator, partial [Candidatus Kariarchaeaceae archaeon]
LLIRAYLFRARLSMLNLQLEEAKKIQVKAHDLAEEKGLRHLSFLVSNEMDEFARQVNRWGELASSSFDVEQVIELSQLEMILNRTDLTEQEVNMGMPILLLILSKDGGVLFSNKFSELDVNEDMVGSFLNAIKRLGEDAFYKKGSIDRIVHQNYTILIKLVGSFSFCFVLEGSSYGTIEKFDVFIDTVQSTTAWQNFHTHPVQMDNDLFTILKRICDDLFDPEILTAEVNTGSQKDEIYEEEPDYLELPKELLTYKFLLNPIRLSIVKVLNKYFRYPAADLRKLLVIPWGTFNDHVTALSKKGFIELKREFLEENPRNILYITSSGVSEYMGVKSKLTSLLTS